MGMTGDGFTFGLPHETIDAIAAAVIPIVLAETNARNGEQWPAAMNIDTAARYTDSTVERLRKLVAARRIPFVQEASGCAIRSLRVDLDAWLAEQRVEQRGGIR